MKKITLLLLLFSCFLGYSQLNENFDSGMPASWTKISTINGAVVTTQTQTWVLNTAPPGTYAAHTDPNAAYVNNENIGAGNTEADWLITNLNTVPTNGQLRFYTRQTITGDQNTLYRVYYSTTSQTDLSSFTLLKEYTEDQLTDLSADVSLYEPKSIDFLPAQYNQGVYIAFVRVFTQPTGLRAGDRWLVDDVRMVEKCPTPGALIVSNISSNTLTLAWTNPGGTATNFEIEAVPSTQEPTGTGVAVVVPASVNPSIDLASSGIVLNPQTEYKFYIRAICTDAPSDWSGFIIATTLPLGSVCSGPIVVNSPLPYQAVDNTVNYGDEVDTAQGTQCGATPAGTNYLAGNEVFYSYTAAVDGPFSITMTPMGTPSGNSSLFVYNGCGTVGTSCIAGVANTNSTPRIVTINGTTGTTYVIVISSSAANQSIAYNLLIQNEICAPKPIGLDAQNITTATADLSWNPQSYSSWEVAVQTLNSPIPSGPGTYVTSPSFNPVLAAGVQYQYWVRAECSLGSGTFSAWAGPFPFNSKICEIAQTCIHKFVMTDSANNGWNGARMEVRQNNIVVATIGSTYTSGAGPVTVEVPLCNGVPFDLYWSVAGTAPQQCIVAIVNSFGQTIYTKPAGSGAAGAVVYNNIVNCDTPRCDLPVTNIAFSNITTNGATISWTAPATTSWDVYVALAGGDTPTESTPPTYNDVSTNNFTTTLPLLADTAYDVCVRVNCSPSNSAWVCSSFTTLPTCPKPTSLGVPPAFITETSATLTWTNGTPTDTAWEVLLVPSPTMIPPTQLPPLNPVIENGTLLIPTTTASPLDLPAGTLTQATIYFYYIRTVCSESDKSTWSGPFVFNTVTCQPTAKCNYKFVLTSATGNSWNGARMQIRQNGILIQTIGASGVNNAAGISVGLCDGIPFDVYWSVEGTAPENVGLSIQNPFTDIIFTKPPGTGTPLTVIYTSTAAICTPPTCPKPTALGVVSVGQTTADLSWTESGTATQWEVYAVPVATPNVPPVNGSPVSGVGSYHIVTSNNPAHIDGLLPGTSYIYYVRAICSTTDVGTWTILNPKTFITKPVNDECDFATVVIPNPTRVCTNEGVNGSTLGATRSLPNTTPTCPGNTDDDVWYSFVATSTIHIITFSNLVGGTNPDINHTLYSGADCATQTQMYCSNPNVSVANNLTIGNTYKIRVYTSGGATTTPVSFNVCITTPPPITNDECATAMTAEVNTDIECVVFTSASVTGATPSANPSTCAGTEDDDVWFDFVANSAKQIISFTNVEGTSDNLVHSLFHETGDCNLTLVYCNSTEESTANNLIVGDHYKIRVWSNENTIQDITFDLCIGKVLPPIVVSTTQYTKQQLIEDILLDSSCASVTDITFSTGTNFGSVNGIGYFNSAQSQFDFQDGIVLSTGAAMSAPGPNMSVLSEGTFNWPGDDDLEAILPMVSNNATVLEFNFIPLQDHISFRYKFASDEYGQWQCAYSDAFAFILTNNSTGAISNLAIVPDSNPPVPVAVTTVCDQLFNNGCPSVNPDKFDTYYGPLGVNPIGAPINFNGVTETFTAFSQVTAGTQYHIKLVIADRGDTAFDSAVFLDGGSFDIGNVELGSDFLQSAGNAICYGDTVILDSQLDPDMYDFQWLEGPDPIPGATNPTLEVTEPGVYSIKANFINTTCVAQDSITVEFFEDVPAGTPENLTECDASGIAVFDLTVNTEDILAPFPVGTHTAVYFLTEDDAVNNNLANAIATPENFTGTDGQTIYVRTNKTGTSCKQVVSFTLTVQDLTPVFTIDGNLEYCPQSNTTLTVVATDNNFDVNDPDVHFTWTYNGGAIPDVDAPELMINPTGTPPTPYGYGTYTVTVDNHKCKNSSANIEVTQQQNVAWNFTINAPSTLCPDETFDLGVTVTGNDTTGTPSYTYLHDGFPIAQDTASALLTDLPNVDGSGFGTYTVIVDILGCTLEHDVTITQGTPTWDFTITGPATLCPAESGHFAVTVVNNTTGEQPQFHYEHNSATTNFGQTFDVVNNNAGEALGVYTITAEIFGCEVTHVFTVNPGNLNDLEVSFVGEPYRICALESVDITVTGVTNPNAQYTWKDSNNTTVGTGAVFTASVVDDYTLTIDIFGCTKVLTAHVAENTDTVSITFNNGCESNDYIIKAIVANPADVESYTWHGPAFLPGETPDEIVASAIGTYNVDIKTKDGCISKQNISVTDVACDIQKGISPNHDGKNDNFDLTALNVKHLGIYNRYGTEVYQTKNYKDQWFGQSSSGEELPDATYFYVIEKQDGKKLTGWIYLNR